MVPAGLVVEPTAEQAARAAADRIAASLRASINAHGSASVAFSGGNTPTAMLEALAEDPLKRAVVEWRVGQVVRGWQAPRGDGRGERVR